MAQLLIRGLDIETVNYFKSIAKQHHRSLQGEVKYALENLVKTQRLGKDSIVKKQPSNWPEGFLESVLGKWQGELLTREYEGDFEKREDFK